MNNRTSHTFYVTGMHCKACVLLTESEVGELSNVSRVSSDLSAGTIVVEGDFGGRAPADIAAELSSLLKPHGYEVKADKPAPSAKWSEFRIAVPIALGFALLFYLLQKAGLVSLVSGGSVTYGTAFLIGIIASLSSCMAVVGGLVLSMSATFAKEGDRMRPQVLFHGGRLVSFFILGGVIGAIGKAFTLSIGATFTLSLLIGLVMLVLGINLLDVFSFMKKFQPSMPRAIANRAHAATKLNHTLTPLVAGVITFFLPCGFTQSMQLYTLSTGSFWAGALTMISFALGTLPVLLAVSLSSYSVKGSPKSGVFFKSAGLIVIMFALFNILNSLAVIGVVPPLFNF